MINFEKVRPLLDAAHANHKLDIEHKVAHVCALADKVVSMMSRDIEALVANSDAPKLCVGCDLFTEKVEIEFASDHATEIFAVVREAQAYCLDKNIDEQSTFWKFIEQACTAEGWFMSTIEESRGEGVDYVTGILLRARFKQQ